MSQLPEMAVMPSHDVRVWTASPREVGDRQWALLAASLDPVETTRAGRFNNEADRRSYVLAHGMRRLLVSRALAVAPAELVFSSAENGRPLLLEPQGQHIFFSHSHSRDAATCAVSRFGPLGVDVEATKSHDADFDLLEQFVVLPASTVHESNSEADRSRHFWFYWTAVEAFWKAAGTGFSDHNPRICCRKTSSGLFDIVLESDSVQTIPAARLIPVAAPAGFTIGVVVMNSIAIAL